MLRVVRLVSAVAGGRILNPKTAEEEVGRGRRGWRHWHGTA